MKKKYILLTLAAFCCIALSAADLTGKRIYVNPGHGSFGPNDRPMATIPFPNLKTTSMPDTCGFYETNTNLWKCLYLGQRLEQAGAYVMYSRKANGPWPYTMVDGDYPDYTYDGYKALPDYEKYNRNLSEICEEVEANNMDLFISVHSNAATDGTTSNYPLWLYRGYDTPANDFETAGKAIGAAMWPYRYEMMASGYDPASYYSLTNMNLRGDINFYGSSSTRYSAVSGNSYTGYLGVLKHGTVGGLFEGYFHTYQPARHRALNHDNCHMEGYAYYRGIIDYFGADKDTKGYILGTVKDLHEKMNNPLFNYSPKTNDQWVPCNGATVKLLKDGIEIASYQVDTFYNGVFYFGDLEPGNYTLDATCAGYKPLFDEYKTAIKVEANKVTYPFIYLESETYKPPKVVYKDYMDPEQPAWLGMPSRFLFADPTDATAEVLADKTVHKSLLQNDTTMYVLAFDAEEKPYIYLVNPTTMAVLQQISTEGMQGSLRAVGDIALTADGVLLACNYSENQFSADYVSGGNTGVRGTFRVYKWNDFAAAPVEMFTSQYCANWYRGNIGNSMSVSGASDDFTMVVTCPTIAESGVLRLVVFGVTDGNLVSTMRNQDPNGTPALTLPNYGWDMQLKPSPLNEGAFMLIGDKLGVTEITFNADAQPPTYLGRTDFVADGATFFRYAGHSLMAVPQADGVYLYDITDGLDNAVLIKTNTQIQTPESAKKRRIAAAESAYSLAAGTVAGEDITLYWLADNKMTRYTTKDTAQPLAKGIYAYNLNVVQEKQGEHTYSFTANAAGTGVIIFYKEDGTVAGEYSLGEILEGQNSIQIADSDLPGDYGDSFTWAVELTSDEVARWSVIHAQTKVEMGMSRVFNTVDNNPQNPTFGRIYLADYVRNSANSGLYAVNPDYSFINTTPMLGGNSLFGCLYRIGIDDEGYVYMPDWTDGNSGVYIANPTDFSSFPNMFQGTRDGNGVISYNGIEVGSSTPAVHVYGKGADTKLIVYNEDPGTTLVTNGLCIYDIGQPDGTIRRTWNEAPSKVLSIPGQLNSEGNVLGTDRGIWVSQNRGSGNNNASATSLQFFDWNGNRKFSSAVDPYKDIILGSEGSSFALSADEKTLVLNGVDKSFYVFDIEWQDDTPVLTLRYEYKHGYGSSSTDAFRQFNFDYAGNLIATGDPGFYVFAMPHEGNTMITPAKNSLVVEKTEAPQIIAVENIELDIIELELDVNETATLTATITPVDADNQNITWSSSDESVATVVDGVVTAIAAGNAVITVTTEDGGFTAQCNVTVKLPDGLEQLAANGIYYRNGIIYNENGIDLQVYNVNGTLVASGNGNINMTGAANGVYIIYNANNINVKIVK